MALVREALGSGVMPGVLMQCGTARVKWCRRLWNLRSDPLVDELVVGPCARGIQPPRSGVHLAEVK